MKANTIAAISTASGMAAVGVIRISGEEAILVADKVFKTINGEFLNDTKGYHAHYGKVYNGNDEIDEAIALVFRAPHSYTGENIVEISCHGGMYTTQKTLETVLKNGALPAQPGEFTKRAYLNGKMKLTQAEAVMDIIKANTMQAGRAALSLKGGSLHKLINKIKQSLINIVGHVCAYIDYPEEEIPKVEEEKLLSDIKKSEIAVKKLIDEFKISKIIREGVDTVIVGKPNVGKSTLMNLLAGSSRSIVTDIPGTTRDIIEETVNLGNITLRLSDTAGIHKTNNPVEQIGVKKAKDKLESAELILALFDSSKELSNEDKELVKELKSMPCIAVINKSDLEQKLDCSYLEVNLNFVVKISAKTGDGKDLLKKALEDFFKINKFEPSQAMLFNERQKQSAENALKDIKKAYSELKNHMTLDAVAYLLEQAISVLSQLDGENATDEIIDDVFSRFCVGK